MLPGNAGVAPQGTAGLRRSLHLTVLVAVLLCGIAPRPTVAQSTDSDTVRDPMSVEAQVLEMIEAGAVEGVPGDVRRALKRRAEETRAPGRKAGAPDQLPAPIRSSMLSRGQLRAAGMASGGSGWEARSGTLNGVVRENAFSFVWDIAVKDGVLYVGGGGIPFTGNGKRINNIARFDGTQWEVLGSGLLNTSARGIRRGPTYSGGRCPAPPTECHRTGQYC